MVCGCGLAYPVLHTDQLCAVVRTAMNIMDSISCGESFTGSIIMNLITKSAPSLYPIYVCTYSASHIGDISAASSIHLTSQSESPSSHSHSPGSMCRLFYQLFTCLLTFYRNWFSQALSKQEFQSCLRSEQIKPQKATDKALFKWQLAFCSRHSARYFGDMYNIDGDSRMGIHPVTIIIRALHTFRSEGRWYV